MASFALACAMLSGCDSSSSSSSSESSSSASSSSDASSQDSGESSSASSEGNSSAAESSSKEEKKINAIGYDVKNSSRLFDNIKKTYSGNYKVTASFANQAGATIIVNLKDNKVYCSQKSSGASTAILYTGGNKATSYDLVGSRYQEQTVTDTAKFIKQKDLLFGMTGDFVKAQIDSKTDIIIEMYKINKDVAGADGQIGYCFKGEDGSFCEMFIMYDGQEMPSYFGVSELVKASDELFKEIDTKSFTKVG
ncbi:MAG: hypothetical protein IKH90_10345 [Ruminococcus sp.]|nr:hypothetical protein [Ruminococcus sp.]